ncbi:MAG: hypothetical protein EP338_14200 [Bacteroidetes bacterium]|nr:MAG: hypothetical protein EP338_14200 [Bacteroidota bacterium]
MSFKKIYLLYALLVMALLSSCKKEEKECHEKQTAYVTSVTAPSNGKVFENIPVTVYFKSLNSCGSFSRFMEEISGNKRLIEVEARYDGCTCSSATESLSQTYTFQATQTGDYELRFKSSASEEISVKISIN